MMELMPYREAFTANGNLYHLVKQGDEWTHECFIFESGELTRILANQGWYSAFSPTLTANYVCIYEARNIDGKTGLIKYREVRITAGKTQAACRTSVPGQHYRNPYLLYERLL